MDLRSKIEKNMLEYVSIKTHTGTSLERNNLIFFKNWFERVDYFKENPEYYGFYDIKGDQLKRKIPWGLLKGEGNDTIILIHHSDTVDTEDYGKFKHLAYSPYELTEKYRESSVELDEDSRMDLDSGQWLFGRGVADMKGGAAIHLALFEEYSKYENFNGNILLLSVPDEENLSQGMRGAVYLLKELKERFDLNYILMLNVEPHGRNVNNVATIYDGSVGKIMPVVYVRGKLTHVGQIFSGLNPINLLSEIIRRTELNCEFIEHVDNTTTPPPTWLYFKDRKEVYDVSIPIAAAGYMNMITLDKPPKEIFDRLKEIAFESFEKVIEDMNLSYGKYKKLSCEKVEYLNWKPKVKFYSELYEEALKVSGEDFINVLKSFDFELKNKISKNEILLTDAALMMIEKTLEFVKDQAPMVVIALMPPYYPNVSNSMIKEKSRNIHKAVDKAVEFAKVEWNEEINVKSYFTGISDLSYAMFEVDEENIRYIEENMLMWGDIYYIPLDIIRELSIPVLNIGPWGKDIHKYTERVYIKDLYYRTPILIDKLIRELLNNSHPTV